MRKGNPYPKKRTTAEKIVWIKRIVFIVSILVMVAGVVLDNIPLTLLGGFLFLGESINL